jgi:hypothetical protein
MVGLWNGEGCGQKAVASPPVEAAYDTLERH